MSEILGRSQREHGFIYLWFNKKRKMYYIGSHWGTEDDGYICSSNWMRNDYNRHKEDFKRRIIERIFTNKKDLLKAEERWLGMMDEDKWIRSNPTYKSRENVRYYNINRTVKNPWYMDENTRRTVGEKISFLKKGIPLGPCSSEKAVKISQATTGIKKTYTPETYQSLIDSRTGRQHSDEWKEANSVRLKEQWKDGTRKAPEHQSEESNLKRSQKLKGRSTYESTPESRKAQSDARKALWADPEYRSRMTALRRARKNK